MSGKTFRCAICGAPYMLWSDGLHHDERWLDRWHDVEMGDPWPAVDERLLPPDWRRPR